MPEHVRRLVRKIRNREGSPEELDNVIKELTKASTAQMHDKMERQLRDIMQQAGVFSHMTGAMPCLFVAGRYGSPEEAEATTVLEVDPDKHTSQIGVVLTGKMNAEDIRLFADYIKAFIRDITPAGGTAEMTKSRDRLPPRDPAYDEPKEESP